MSSSDVLERCTFVKKKEGKLYVVGGGYSAAKKGRAQNFLLLASFVWGIDYIGWWREGWMDSDREGRGRLNSPSSLSVFFPWPDGSTK